MIYQLKIFIYKKKTPPHSLPQQSQVQPKRKSANLKMWEQNNNPAKNGKKGTR